MWKNVSRGDALGSSRAAGPAVWHVRGGGSCRGDARAPRERSVRVLAVEQTRGEAKGEGRLRGSACSGDNRAECHPSPGSQGTATAPFQNPVKELVDVSGIY